MARGDRINSLPSRYARQLQRLDSRARQLQARAAAINAQLDMSLKLAHKAGWRYTTLGAAIGETPTSIRARCERADDSADPLLPPDPPAPSTPASKSPKVSRPALSQGEIAQLRQLHAKATRRRGNGLVVVPGRQAAKDLAAALRAHHHKGVPLQQLADAIGPASAMSVRRWLARHGPDAVGQK